MRLPVDQYVCIKIPLAVTLERIVANGFLLSVPDVCFFKVSVAPRLKVFLSQTDSSVVIESTDVILGGSPFVESLKGC